MYSLSEIPSRALRSESTRPSMLAKTDDEEDTEVLCGCARPGVLLPS